MGMLIIPMAISPPITTNNFSSFCLRKPSLVISKANLSTIPQNHTRRCGNYKPPMWDFQYIQSIHNDYVGEEYMKRFNELMKEMKKNLMVMVEGSQELEKLELIDNLQRLGVSYHFKDEIMQILRSINQHTPGDSLYSTALKFRLLRQHDFHIYQDMLGNFKDENGNLKHQSFCNDTKGLLQLYEASFLSMDTHETTTLLESHLKTYLNNNKHGHEDNYVTIIEALVRHALELPLHCMMLRVETSWYLNIYEKMTISNPLLLELAKLDFNIVQATHQQDLRYLSRWWKSSSLAENLPFARDRIVEAFFWIVGTMFEPQYSNSRRMLTKVAALGTVIDDIYDVYGTFDELELFTDAVERSWADLCKALLREAKWYYNGYNPSLEEYMDNAWMSIGIPVIVINVFFCVTNPITKEAIESLSKYPHIIRCSATIIRLADDLATSMWADLCKALLREAKWYYNGYNPSLEEYMDNAWMSIGIPVIVINVFFCVTNPITKEAIESLSKYPHIIRCSATIIRLADDLATSMDEMERGNVPKSIQCYMNDHKGASEKEARKHINYLIKETWKLLNISQLDNSLFSKSFIECAINIARTGQTIYQHGDGHGIQNYEIKNRISKLFFEPIK